MRRTEYLGGWMSAIEAGDGPVAILVHGFPLDGRMWLDQLDALAGESRRVIAPDVRGHGRSPWTGDDIHAMDLLADDLIALIETQKAGPVDLVGFSMGGYVVLSLAERRPDLIRSLALVDTKATADSAEGRAGRDAMAAAVIEEGRTWLAGTLLPKLLAETASTTVRGRLRSMIEGQSYETIVADLAGMRDRPDRMGVLTRVPAPVGIVVGAMDMLTPPTDSEAMAAACRDVELTVVPGVGHMAPMEAPEAVSQALARLWDRVG